MDGLQALFKNSDNCLLTAPGFLGQTQPIPISSA